MAQTHGTIVQCIGAVTDIQFDRDSMPGIYDALLLQRNLAHAMRGRIDRLALLGDAGARRQRAVTLLERARALRPAATWARGVRRRVRR